MRRMNQGACQSELLLHTAGELPGPALAKGPERGHGKQFIEAGLSHVVWDVVQIGEKREVLFDRQILIEAKALRHIADPGLELQRFTWQRVTEDAKRLRNPAGECRQAAEAGLFFPRRLGQ